MTVRGVKVTNTKATRGGKKETERSKAKNEEVKKKQKKTVKANQNSTGKEKVKESNKAKKKEVQKKQDKIVKAKQNGTGKEKEKKGEETYLIEKLVADKKENGVWKIEVKWKGYAGTTWEPVSSLKKQQPDMVKTYMQQIAGKKRATAPKTQKNKRMFTSLL